jgi:hypothetical protein
MITFLGEFWYSLGYIRYPITFSLLAVIALALLSAGRLFRPGAVPDRYTKAWIDAVLFWGGFALVCGVLGTLVGISIGAHQLEGGLSIPAEGGGMEATAPLIWGGLKVALTPSIYGHVTLAFAGLLWFALQLKWRFMGSPENEPAG